jgi:hypothetical protein
LRERILRRQRAVREFVEDRSVEDVDVGNPKPTVLFLSLANGPVADPLEFGRLPIGLDV